MPANFCDDARTQQGIPARMTKSTIVRTQVTGAPLEAGSFPISLMERASVADFTKVKGRGHSSSPPEKSVPAPAEVVVDLFHVFEPGVDEVIVNFLPVYGAGWGSARTQEWAMRRAALMQATPLARSGRGRDAGACRTDAWPSKGHPGRSRHGVHVARSRSAGLHTCRDARLVAAGQVGGQCAHRAVQWDVPGGALVGTPAHESGRRMGEMRG